MMDDTGMIPNFDAAKAAAREEISVDDFWSYLPQHDYIFAPTRAHWPGSAVNSRLPAIKVADDKAVAPAAWLDKHRPVEQMTWAPGLPMIIRNRLILEGGWIKRRSVTVFNLYHPPMIAPGDAEAAGKWAEHVRFVYPDEAEHIFDWLAHRVQRPTEKINHALVLGGEQGIGKDTLLEPVKHAVGPWNFQDVSPTQVLGRFNGFLKSVILRISEARDLGEFSRFAFYDHMKAYIAAPPDVLRIDEKHLREYPIINCCGVILTSNHLADGIYLPTDDRRHFVAWSTLTKDHERFQGDYWKELWAWYRDGGTAHVAAWLARRNLSGFDPKAPPPKTAAFWTIVDSGQAPETPEAADAIDRLGNPPAFTLENVRGVADDDFRDWLADRKNRRVIPHRIESCGYAPVRNPDAVSDGQWKIRGKRQAVYALKSLPLAEQVKAARDLCR